MRRVVAIIAAVVLLGACGSDDGDGGAGGAPRRVTLVLNWTPNAHHLGIYAAKELGWYSDAGIDLAIVEPAEGGAEQAVGTGDAQFGISMAEAVLPARAQGIPIVSVATILPVNDSALMALATDGIATPGDLAGKTYGGYGGPLETELINRLAECGGADPKTIEHVEVGNVDYLAGMESGRFDFVWIFSGWDGERARLEGKPVNLVKFEDHLDCIPNWYTPLVIANERTLRDDPELAQAFLEVTARGYGLASDDPQEAADAMLRVTPETDGQLLRAAADYHASRFTLTDQPWGIQDAPTWEAFERFLEDAGLVEEPVKAGDAFTNDFLPR
jgi:ABC-type nitrate/sulfonate/bicarbonate transport system substrate-binding protein